MWVPTQAPPLDNARAPARAGALRLTRLAGPAALAELEPRLDALTLRQPRPTPYTSVPYLQAMGRAADDAFDFRAVWRGEELIGVLPLARSGRSRFGVPLPRLGFAPLDPPLPGDWLLAPDCRNAVPQIIAELRRTRDWADGYLRKVPGDSPLTAAGLGAGIRMRPHGGECSAPLATSWETLCAGWSANRRRHARRLLRMDGFGPGVRPKVTVFPDDGADCDALRATMQRVLDAGWKGRRGPARAQSELLLRMVPAMAARGRVACFLLSLDARPAAFLLLFQAGAHLYAMLNAHDPAAEAGSPGAALIAQALRWGCERGAAALHFGNDAPYLRHWASAWAPYYAVRFFNTTWRGRALQALRFPAPIPAAAPGAERPA